MFSRGAIGISCFRRKNIFFTCIKSIFQGLYFFNYSENTILFSRLNEGHEALYLNCFFQNPEPNHGNNKPTRISHQFHPFCRYDFIRLFL